ncbi:MAG: DedA family protein [Rhodoglobus sp.]|uniref:DedA family protein n=1 Tax=Salinibacterium sp. G-O1 TaxID=3046208 RepID=UPI0024B96543|nr:DedA family protein [Salinibacterium sp. G-O1]MDJ0334549.1 DedA family protein [Salinibacterium sp. G-O1]
MAPTALIPWLDPANLIEGFGPFALLGVCLIVFAETGLLLGFLLPGDTLLVITGLLTFTGTMVPAGQGIQIPIWLVCISISVAAFLGGEVGYLIGHKAGPRIFERKETGLFSVENVKRTNGFFERFGGLAVIVARFVPIVRTFAPVAAGVGHMNYKKYSLYNAIGAIIWGSGLTFLGFVLGYIPPLSDFVTNYIDVILLAAVAIAVVPTVYHYIQSMVKARRRNAAILNDAEAEALVLDEKKFDQKLGD